MSSTTTSDPTETLSFTLNSAALSDIRGSAGGFFSIGGSLDTTGQAGDYTLFSGSSAAGVQRLVLNVESVPEPASLAMVGLGLAGLGLVARRRKA